MDGFDRGKIFLKEPTIALWGRLANDDVAFQFFCGDEGARPDGCERVGREVGRIVERGVEEGKGFVGAEECVAQMVGEKKCRDEEIGVGLDVGGVCGGAVSDDVAGDLEFTQGEGARGEEGRENVAHGGVGRGGRNVEAGEEVHE